MAAKASADDVEISDSRAADPKMEPSEHAHGAKSSNAFAELMKPKSRVQPASLQKTIDKKTDRTTFLGRDGLQAYIDEPEQFPKDRVVYYVCARAANHFLRYILMGEQDDKFVVINDLYPKATVHLLILPRDSTKNILRGQEAFEDAQFLADCRVMERKVRAMVAGELRRKLGRFSTTEAARREAQEADDIPEVVPLGRDWESEVMSGTHANPSMSSLHVHVMSKDLHSECLKKTNHYLSFTTDFFIRMDEYPLADEDRRRHYGRFPPDMICWRCERGFGNKMSRLKEHLEEEFEEWKKQ